MPGIPELRPWAPQGSRSGRVGLGVESRLPTPMQLFAESVQWLQHKGQGVQGGWDSKPSPVEKRNNCTCETSRGAESWPSPVPCHPSVIARDARDAHVHHKEKDPAQTFVAVPFLKQVHTKLGAVRSERGPAMAVSTLRCTCV